MIICYKLLIFVSHPIPNGLLATIYLILLHCLNIILMMNTKVKVYNGINLRYINHILFQSHQFPLVNI